MFLPASGRIASESGNFGLQSLPEELVPACGPWHVLHAGFSWSEILTSMLMGTGDCAVVQWRDLVLGLKHSRLDNDLVPVHDEHCHLHRRTPPPT